MLIVVGDVETTGLYVTKGDRVIEMGLIAYDTEQQKIVGTLEKRYNNEGRAINKKSQGVHGISAEDLKDVPPWTMQDAVQLNNLFRKADLLVAHNLEFDLNFIYEEIGRFVPDNELSDINTFCTYNDSRALAYEGKKPSLKELAFCCGVEYDEARAHNALYDVEVTLESFLHSWRKGWFHKYCIEAPPFPRWEEL